jgi:hypothetical protein
MLAFGIELPDKALGDQPPAYHCLAIFTIARSIVQAELGSLCKGLTCGDKQGKHSG